MRAGRLRIAAIGLHLHRMDQVGELDRVLDEEDRDVVADQVPVALLGVELDREAAHVARRVHRAGAAGHGGEAHEHLGLLADLGQDLGARVLGQRLGQLEVAVRRRAAGVNDALGDPLVVEVLDLLAQDEVFQQRRAAPTGLQRVLVVADRDAMVGRHPGVGRRGGLMRLSAVAHGDGRRLRWGGFGFHGLLSFDYGNPTQKRLRASGLFGGFPDLSHEL